MLTHKRGSIGGIAILILHSCALCVRLTPLINVRSFRAFRGYPETLFLQTLLIANRSASTA